MTSQTETKAALRKTFRIMFCALALFWSTIAVVAQSTNSGGRFPVYDKAKQEFDNLIPTLSQRNLSPARLTELAGQLSRMGLFVDTLLKNHENSPARMEEHVARLRFLSDNIKAEQAKLSRRQPVNPPDQTEAIRLAFFKDKHQTYAPNEDVEVQVFISKRGANLSPDEQRQMMFAKWIGLMRSSEPHKNISYSSPVRQYQGQAAHAAPSIVTFRAPNEGGLYDIRLFDRESGTELASLQFKIDNIDRLEFIAELERFKAEVDKQRSIFDKQWQYENIKATYMEYFRRAGSPNPTRYADSWSGAQWLKFGGPIGDVVFFRASESLRRSLYNLKKTIRPFTRDDLVHYRQRMELWRARAAEVSRYMIEYAEIMAQSQAALLHHFNLPPKDEQQEFATYFMRQQERAEQRKAVSNKLNRDVRKPVFDYVVGERMPTPAR